MAREDTAEEALALALAVGVGGVEEGATESECALDRRFRFLIV
jgi:hypothetical protein